MICQTGGYAILEAPMLRTTRGASSQVAAARQAEMPQIYEVLDRVGSTAWSINEPVLKIMKQLYHEEKGGLASLPHWNAEPVKEMPKWIFDKKDKKDERTYLQRKQEWNDHRKKVHEAVKVLVENRVCI
jgi:DNA-directed RNA polymerase